MTEHIEVEPCLSRLDKWLLTDLIQCFNSNSCESDTEKTDPNYEEAGVVLEHNGCWDSWKAKSVLKLSPVTCSGRSYRSVCICFLDATLPPKCCLSYIFKESDASTRCMAENNYDKESCSSHFLKYKNCRKFWVSLARSPLSELICYAWVWSLRFVRTHHPSLVMAVGSPAFWPHPPCALRTLGHSHWVLQPFPRVRIQLQLRWVFLRGSVSRHHVSFLDVDGMAGLPCHHVYPASFSASSPTAAHGPHFLIYIVISASLSTGSNGFLSLCSLTCCGHLLASLGSCSWIGGLCSWAGSSTLYPHPSNRGHIIPVGIMGLPWRHSSREPTCNAGDVGLIPGSGTSPREGNDNPLQYSWLGNPMGRGAWRAIIHGVAKQSDGTWHLNYHHHQGNNHFFLMDNNLKTLSGVLEFIFCFLLTCPFMFPFRRYPITGSWLAFSIWLILVSSLLYIRTELCHDPEKTKRSEAAHAHGSRERRDLGRIGEDALLSACIKIIYLT